MIARLILNVWPLQLILTRREEVQLLEDEGEEGMMHSLLTVLPDLYEEGEMILDVPKEKSTQKSPSEPPEAAPDKINT